MRKVTQQRGMALVTVLVIVAFVAIIAQQLASTNMLSHRITQNIIDSDQAFQYGMSIEEMGLALLKLSLENEKGNEAVHLGQQWNQQLTYPIEEGVERDNVGFVNGKATDMQSCINLNAVLVRKKSQTGGSGNNSGNSGGNNSGNSGGNSSGGQFIDISFGDAQFQPTFGQRVLERLFELVSADVEDSVIAPADLAASVRDWVDGDQTPSNAGSAETNDYLGMEKPYRAADSFFGSVTELRVIKGFTKDIYKAISPYVCVIPAENANGPEKVVVNVNTLTPEKSVVLAALYEGMTREEASELITKRPEDGYRENTFQQELGALKSQNTNIKEIESAEVIFISNYFELRIDTTYRRGRAKINSLVKGSASDNFVVVNRYFGEPE